MVAISWWWIKQNKTSKSETNLAQNVSYTRYIYKIENDMLHGDLFHCRRKLSLVHLYFKGFPYLAIS